MKTRFLFAAILALVLFPTISFAQMDERKPGIYAIVGEESRQLLYSPPGIRPGNGGILGVEVGREVHNFKGETSGVEAADTFVLVVDPQNKTAVKTPKKYDPFIRNMTPSDMLLLPLTINQKKGRREYDEGLSIGGIGVGEEAARVDFDWERISENSFEIKVTGLAPGEYGFIFRYSKVFGFDYDGIYGFTIPEAAKE